MGRILLWPSVHGLSAEFLRVHTRQCAREKCRWNIFTVVCCSDIFHYLFVIWRIFFVEYLQSCWWNILGCVNLSTFSFQDFDLNSFITLYYMYSLWCMISELSCQDFHFGKCVAGLVHYAKICKESERYIWRCLDLKCSRVLLCR